jgi:hypothetical protein
MRQFLPRQGFVARRICQRIADLLYFWHRLPDGRARRCIKFNQKDNRSKPTVLRFNVLNIKTAADELRERSVAVEELIFDWGKIGVFFDSDGNRCELKNTV